MTLEDAKAYGVQAGRAVSHHDQALYNHLKNWFREALSIEEHPVELREMWNAGYTEGRNVRRF